MKEKVLTTVVTFETTTQAIAMERECKKNKFTGRLILCQEKYQLPAALRGNVGNRTKKKQLPI